MPNKLINEQVDIYKLPDVELSQEKNEAGEITIGDLHGNAIKLLFMLVKHGIATNIGEEDYKKLVEIYTTPVDVLRKEHLEKFNAIIADMELNSNLKVRLLGDEFADRGNNDYFTLKILEKLAESCVPVEIILSNHSVEFIEAYEKQDKFEPQMLESSLVTSMQNMQSFIDNGHVSREEILKIINRAYKPILKAISYSLSEDKKEITIYSHAAIGLNTIESLAKAINVDYKAATAIELAQTMDEINKKFQEHVQANTVHALYTHEGMHKVYSNSIADVSDTPWEFIMWNRLYNNIDRPAEHSGYSVLFAHGHDSNDPFTIFYKKAHIYNLDNKLGKAAYLNEGKYTVLYTGMATKKEETFFQESSQLMSEAEKVIVEVPPHNPESISRSRTEDELDSTSSRAMLNYENRPTEAFHKHSDSPKNQSLTEIQVHKIKELLCNYLKHLASYPIVISNEQNVLFQEKDDSLVNITQSVVAGSLDEARCSKFNKTCELLIKLNKNDGTFQTDINSDNTKELLSAHRDNMAIRMLKAIRCILTLGYVPERSFFSSRGAQVIEEISDISRVSLSR